MCVCCIKCVDFNKHKIIKNWYKEKNHNYNVLLSGWIIINIINEFLIYILKYPFY